MDCPASCFNQFCCSLIVHGDLYLFSSSIANSNSKAPSSGTGGRAVCIYVCLISLTPLTFSSSEKWLLHLAGILWKSVIKSPFLSFTMRVIPKVMSNFFLHANWEQQTKESMVVDGTSCCVILECLMTSIACIT